jgi:hypothetical protein
MVINKYSKAHWSDTTSVGTYSGSITKDELVELVEYLIDNIHISVGFRHK